MCLLGMVLAFESSKPTTNGHTFYYKVIRNTSQTIQPTAIQSFKYMSL